LYDVLEKNLHKDIANKDVDAATKTLELM